MYVIMEQHEVDIMKNVTAGSHKTMSFLLIKTKKLIQFSFVCIFFITFIKKELLNTLTIIH